MTTRSEPVDYIERTREQYAALGYPDYRWVESREPTPWKSLEKTLAQSRVALVASGGVYKRGQVAFHYRDDTSFRIIDSDTPNANLRATHFAYDVTDARRDPSCVFPLDTLRRLAKEGVIGETAPRAFSFMGGIYSTRKVRELLAPAIAERLIADQVDLALFVPV